jgi:signal transduction histidine kinase
MGYSSECVTAEIEPRGSLSVASVNGEGGRVVVLASSASEEARVCETIADMNLRAELCHTAAELCRRMESGVEVAVIAGELLSGETLALLTETLSRDPPWSDLPLVVLSGGTSEGAWPAIDMEDGILNAILLERTVSTRTLQSAIQSALRARRRQYRIREYLAELTHAEHRERTRLARLLHDHLQQLLVAARIKVEGLERGGDPARVPAALQQVDALLVQVLDASRLLTVELCPPVLREAGFSAALGWLARQIEETHGLHVRVDADPAADPQAEDVCVLLFEAVRELLFNTVKHAGVDHAQVTVTRDERDSIRVVVADEGQGFDSQCLSRLPGSRGGFGLFTLRERLASLGGRLEIDTSPGAGTRTVIVASRH